MHILFLSAILEWICISNHFFRMKNHFSSSYILFRQSLQIFLFNNALFNTLKNSIHQISLSYIFNITKPIIKNSKMNGNKTNNQDSAVCPSLQIKFNTYVQNKIYTNLIKKTIVVLGTRHWKEPKWYLLEFPTFWMTMSINANIEMTKYVMDGAQRSLNDFGSAIIN